MFDMTACGSRIKELRESRIRNDKKMTLEILAEELNISVPHLWRIENGDRAASIDLMIVIAEYFSVSLDYLLLGKAADDTAIRRRVRILTYLGKLDYRDLCGIERAAVVNIKAERWRRKRRNGNETGSAHMGKK